MAAVWPLVAMLCIVEAGLIALLIALPVISRREHAEAQASVDAWNRHCDEVKAREWRPDSTVPLSRRSLPVRMEVIRSPH